jgi:hypothetical protein
VGNRFLKKRAFLAIPDHTPFLRTGGNFFIRLLRGFLISPHVTTLADRRKMHSGSPGRFGPGYVSVQTFTIVQESNVTGKCNPNAIMVFLIDFNALDYSDVRRAIPDFFRLFFKNEQVWQESPSRSFFSNRSQGDFCNGGEDFSSTHQIRIRTESQRKILE